MGLFDLLKVFQEILSRHKEEVLMEIEREEIRWLKARATEEHGDVRRRAQPARVFERAGSRRELVVAFLSVLELVRTTEIK